MTNLSPAAQAVLDALIDGRAEAAVGPQKRITWWNDRVGLAAALRAVAEEIEDLYCESDVDSSDGVVFAMRQLVLIAAELEEQ